MTTFFLDLWQDLREKRLWPVAVGLLAAVVAIPAVMLKPAAEPTPPPTIASNSGQRETLPAVDVDDSPTHGSKLETFSEHNPFKPLKDLEREPGSDSSSGPDVPGQGSGGGGGSSSSSGGGSDSPSIGAPTSGGGGGGTPSGTTPSQGSGPGGLHWFKFTADIEFGKAGNAKSMKKVEPLTLLPSDSAPILVFMGVTADAKGAQFFLADPSYTAEGEGDCNDSENCEFITLHLDDAHNEETLTSNDGSVAYDLKLVKLRREEVSEAEATGDTAPGNDKRSVKAAQDEPVESGKREFLPRLVAAPQVIDELR